MACEIARVRRPAPTSSTVESAICIARSETRRPWLGGPGERPVLAAANRGRPRGAQDWTQAGEGAGDHRHQQREEEHEGIRREVLMVRDLASAQADQQRGHRGGQVQRGRAGNEREHQ